MADDGKVSVVVRSEWKPACPCKKTKRYLQKGAFGQEYLRCSGCDKAVGTFFEGTVDERATGLPDLFANSMETRKLIVLRNGELVEGVLLRIKPAAKRRLTRV